MERVNADRWGLADEADLSGGGPRADVHEQRGYVEVPLYQRSLVPSRWAGLGRANVLSRRA